MNYLLFFITSIFSFIFFIFYRLNILEEKTQENSVYDKTFSSLSGNLIIESMIFFIIAIFLFIYFSNNSFKNKLVDKIKKIIPKKKPKEEIPSNELHLFDNTEIDENLDNQNNKALCGQKELNKKNIFNISEDKIYIFRAISFVILYIFTVSGMIFLYSNFSNLTENIINNLFNNIFSINTIYFLLNILIFIFLIISGFININIHKKFQNYISLFFSILTFVFIFNFLFKLIFTSFLIGSSDFYISKNLLILNITISFFIIVLTYLYKQRYLFDYTFLHFCAYLVNILGIIYYFYITNFNLNNLSMIIFLEIIFLLLSYFKLRKNRGVL